MKGTLFYENYPKDLESGDWERSIGIIIIIIKKEEKMTTNKIILQNSATTNTKVFTFIG